ncbi:MAG: hypothetical protein JSW25_04390 [Thermoplasmata archaeon]|nr:MAG: hypothetical protein JSW25_04390 [Thermoplasmata archaeon]
MDLTDPDFWIAIAILAVTIAGVSVIAWALLKGYREQQRYEEIEEELEDIISREEIQLLRHRDLDAFAAKVNEIRAAKGQEPVPKEFLEKIRYNLMYALDESDF